LYNHGWIYFVFDQLSKIEHGEPIVGMEDELLGVNIFSISGINFPIRKYLWKGYFENEIPKEKKMIVKYKPYTL